MHILFLHILALDVELHICSLFLLRDRVREKQGSKGALMPSAVPIAPHH